MQQDPQPTVDLRAGPDWPALRALAAGQAGHFTAAQALAIGFSEQLLAKHAAANNLERAMRGIYRLAHFPTATHEDLVVAWLWSGGEGVISHETALQLHGLSDALPARIHLTLPTAHQRRRRVVPPLYALHFADLPPADRAWQGPVPLTTAARTVNDVATDHGDGGLVAQAIDEGLKRGAFTVQEVAPAVRYGQDPSGPNTPLLPEATALGDRYIVHAFSGQCRRAPPADWPTRARSLVAPAGGQILLQGFRAQTGTLMLHTAWPLPGPDPATVSAIRAALGAEFQWR